MRVLPVPFAILVYFGIWMPIGWTRKWKKSLYIMFSALVLFTMYTFVGSQLVEVIVYLFQYKGISKTLYLLLTTSSACYKAVAFLIKKRDIISLSDMLLSDQCTPQDAEEKAIQKKFDRINRYVTGVCVALVHSNILTMVVAPLLQTSDRRKLPYKTWLPYCIQDPHNYWLSYMHQTVGLLCCGSASLAIDNIVTGFMSQACSQYEILEHRLKILPERVQSIRSQMSNKESSQVEKMMLIQHLKHHDYLYLYAKNVMKTFGSVIFVQFCTSAVVITVSVYELSMTSPNNLDFVTVLVYLISMLTEFFMYCWFGNEVCLKSIEFAKNVYRSNWTILNLQSWKMILLLIHRSSKPIVISCYKLIVLSLRTFVQILKFSYSSYNILRKSNLHQF